MTEPVEQPASEELPPFSFSKKPIRSNHPASAIPHNIHKSVSRDSKPFHQPSLNNIDYDEQIRAPRMSSANQYTYKPESPRPFTDRNNSGSSISVLQAKESPSATKPSPGSPAAAAGATHSDESASAGPVYQPATVDLNQPTRRNSEPVKTRWGLSAGNLLFVDPVDGADVKLDAERATPESGASGLTNTSMQSKLIRAIENLNGNVTQSERVTDGAAGDGKPTVFSTRAGPMIQQVYTMKKPMCVPAVLRPSTDEDKIHEEDFHHDVSPEEVLPSSKLTEFPFEIPKEMPAWPDIRAEPTHDHWRPDNSTDHCMNCFEVFGGFFNPQRRRRHHCRFCGLLYCYNCLYKAREQHQFELPLPLASEVKSSTRTNSWSSNSSSIISSISGSSGGGDDALSGIMLDAKARLVIPVFQNLAAEGMPLQVLQEKFKVCKVCKTCGSNFSRLLHLLNQRSRIKNDITTPYIFVENPYMSSTFTSQPLYDIKAVMSKSEQRFQNASERRQSFNMPSDWTWSSF